MNGTQIPAVIVVRSSLALLEECKPDASDPDDAVVLTQPASMSICSFVVVMVWVSMAAMTFMLFMGFMLLARHPLVTHFVSSSAVEIFGCFFGFFS